MAIKIPKTPTGIKGLAQRELNKAKRRKRVPVKQDSFKDGNPNDITRMGFKVTKKQKREFVSTCQKMGLNQSAYLKACMKILSTKKGNFLKVKKEIETLLENILGPSETGEKLRLSYTRKEEDIVE